MNIPIEHVTIFDVEHDGNDDGDGDDDAYYYYDDLYDGSSRRRMQSRNIAFIHYTIDTNTHAMGITDDDDIDDSIDTPAELAEAYFNYVKDILVTATESQVFIETLRIEAINVANSLNVESSYATYLFSDFSSEAAIVSEEYDVRVACAYGYAGNSLTCEKCPIDTYTDEFGLKKCKVCNYPYATLQDGAKSCDAYRLGGHSNGVIIMFVLILLVYILSIICAINDHLATFIFTFLPAKQKF